MVYVPAWKTCECVAETFLIWRMSLDEKHVNVWQRHFLYGICAWMGKTCLCGRDISYKVYVYMSLDGENMFVWQRHFLYGVCVYVPGWENMLVYADISYMVYVYMSLDGKTC